MNIRQRVKKASHDGEMQHRHWKRINPIGHSMMVGLFLASLGWVVLVFIKEGADLSPIVITLNFMPYFTISIAWLIAEPDPRRKKRGLKL